MKPRTLLVLAIASIGLSGCMEYLDRRDTVAYGAGNAAQANIVTHMVDPWPPNVKDRRIVHDGERMRWPVERYRLPPKETGAVVGAPAQ